MDTLPRRLLAAAALVTLSILPAPGRAAPVPAHAAVEAHPRFAPLRREILARVAAGEAPSISIAVAKDGVVLWEESIGWADPVTQREATPRTAYTGASIAKTVTAIGALTLIDDGTLKLDEPVGRYLQEGDLLPLADELDRVTVRSLLTMTAGLPQGFEVHYAAHAGSGTRDELRRHGGLIGMPVGEFWYSNYSFALLELVIEGATGTAFDAFMRERVFAPLGMIDTYFETYGRPAGVAVASNFADGRPVPPHVGSGGVRISIHDLLQLARVVLGEAGPHGAPLLSGETVGAMRTPQIEFEPPLSDYGLGLWVKFDSAGRSLVITNGHGPGGVGELLVLPQEGLAVATLMNTRGTSADFPGELNEWFGARVVDLFVPGFLSETERRKRAVRDQDQRYRPSREWLGTWSGQLREVTGEWTPVSLLFQPDGDIHVRLGEQFTTLLDDPRVQSGVLRGGFAGWMNVGQQTDHDLPIYVSLRRVGDRLTGFFSANYEDDRGAYERPNFVRLTRSPAPTCGLTGAPDFSP